MAIYKRTPKTNAQARLEYLKSMQEQTIPLYENKPVEQEVSLSDRIFEINKARNQAFKEQYEYLDEAQSVLLTNALFYSILNPVLEEFGASTHEKNVGAGIITNFIQEQNIPELLEDWKHKSIYLAEIANAVDKHTNNYKNRVIGRQLAIAARFHKIADAIAIDSNNAEKNATSDIKNDNKKYKMDDVDNNDDNGALF